MQRIVFGNPKLCNRNVTDGVPALTSAAPAVTIEAKVLNFQGVPRLAASILTFTTAIHLPAQSTGRETL
jgi:hypothetical protein